MNPLLIAATFKEIAPFIQKYKNEIQQWTLDMDVLITGIGLTATAYQLSKQIQIKKPTLVIQAGVAGCFDKQMPLGSVVLVKQDAIADESVVELKQLRTLFDLKLLPQKQFPFQKGWLVNSNTLLLKKNNLKMVKGISVNQITSSQQMIGFYKKYFNPVVESMEGAAMHYVCLMENI
ncbi:MAG: futalosine hydrolase, partial [Bacteroidia bacterium]|nr:futalosine hydrolase [Bacteroidia bacterium]